MFILSIDVGWKNLAYCILRLDGDTVEIKDWNLKNLLDEDVNVNKLSIDKLLDASAKKLNEFISESKQTLKNIDETYSQCRVYIEAQPMGPFSKNIKTKVLSHIFQFSYLNEIQVLFINSKKKLKNVLKGEKLYYSKLKKKSVDHTMELLEKYKSNENKKFIAFFQEKKGKRDDLADCFLQAIYGME